MFRFWISLQILLFCLVLAACGRAESGMDRVTYEQEILDWRAGRLERLLAPTGYLNQVGLYWLKDGRYTFGSDPSADIRFPPSAPPRIGVFEVSDGGVRMIVDAGVDVRQGTDPVSDIRMAADTEDDPTMVSLGSLAWSVIDREGQLGVRVRDFEHPFLKSFGSLPYYDIDPGYRVEAVLRRYETPQIANVGTVIEGLGYHPTSPGVVVFELAGKTYELEAYESGDRLFYVFGDTTNRGETYGAGRFLYSSAPDEKGVTVLDFNQAYSPPCAFNDFSTCPVASPRNRLPIPVRAGEKYEAALHFPGYPES